MSWDTLFADNRAAWDQRVPIHAASRFYDVAGFKRGASTLQDVELGLVGDVSGKSLLHLQCHFGLDTLSWARRGARVVGVDFSARAIELARELARDVGVGARFVECNVYDTRAHLEELFDVVFTSYGVIGWLPELCPWAQVIAASLAPGGRFVLVELHPYLWMSQVGPDLLPRYSYFNTGPISEVTSGTYAERSAQLSLKEHGWNHPIADVINALLEAGLVVDRVGEHDTSPWEIFPNMERAGAEGYCFSAAPKMVPMLFSLRCVRRG
ncbi:MAG: hypothetical protein A2138_18645 [Deltaproteobacteria bacterium RBG_16_71_12]|nr:MAG: hypothetical protein A2138_18645 [Deltaproteobacteria bacterium RBG_16_71_12]